MDIDSKISIDPYFLAQVQWKLLKNLRGDSIRTGRISSEGGLGNWTGIQNVFLECLPLALHNSSSSAIWLLLNYLIREILGRTRNGDGSPKTYIKFKPTYIQKKSYINSPPSLYGAKRLLEEKGIIYFKEDNVYLNIFPSTWIIDNEKDKNKINSIVEKEIGRIYTKISKVRNEDEDS